MDLNFSDEQTILRDMVRNLCAEHSSTRIVREMENDPLGVPAGLWGQMKDTGLLAMMLPEQYGGIGLDMLDRAVIYHELGRALAPGPHFVSSVMGALAIQAGGSEEQKGRLLPAIGSGELIVTPAWLEPDNGFGAAGVQLRAAATPEGYRLSGVKRHVFYARAAQKLIVLARTGEAPEAIDLLLVDADAPGVTLVQQLSMASDTQYKVGFDDVAVPAADRHRRAALGLDDLGGVHVRGHDPAGGAGDRRCRARARDHRRVRQGPRAVRQADRCLPGAGALHGRRGRGRGGREDTGAGGRVGAHEGQARSRASRRWRSSSRATPSAT